jgi:hypothetical protein
MFSKNEMYKSWIGVGGVSNHIPIMFKIQNEMGKLPFPFKFNTRGLDDEEYRFIRE